MVLKSNVVIENKLVSYEHWSNYIDDLKSKSSAEITQERKAIEILEKPFLNAIKTRLPSKKFGILFSGGVDSTAIAFMCQKFNTEFICYTVGIEGSQDIEMSTKIAKDLKFSHVKKTLSIKEMEELFEKTSRIMGPYLNIVNLGVGAVELAALDLAKKDNIDTFFGGLGSEEIFAGYKRHENSKNINEECWQGLKTTWERDFNRDFRIAIETNSKFLTPFLDKQLIIAAMSVSGELKIKNNYKKYIFRKLIEKLGLKKEYVFRPKKAAQYGSRFDKAIMKITKAKGYKYKKEYLEFLSNNK